VVSEVVGRDGRFGDRRGARAAGGELRHRVDDSSRCETGEVSVSEGQVMRVLDLVVGKRHAESLRLGEVIGQAKCGSLLAAGQ